uniref:Transposase Tc1-like domain-containing protein n=1 Tax=Cyprinus carpio carpio TaxID=630221 RepID=A0A9J8BZ89_CYPCA
MGKTADLTAVQKAIIDTLKRKGQTQKEISELIGCSQSAVSRHLSGKSVGRKKCGKKRCTTRRGDRTLRKIVEKDRFQTLGDLRKQWTESGVETSRATVHRRVLLNQKQRQKRLTWATEKQHWTVAQWSKVLFSDESKFCMSFGNQGASEKEARDGTDGVDDYSRVSGMEIHGRAQGIVDHSRSLELET